MEGVVGEEVNHRETIPFLPLIVINIAHKENANFA